MPRLRTVVADAGSMPAELRSRLDPVWRDAAATEVWLARHGLTVEAIADGPLTRFEQCAEAWALAAGLVRRYGANPRPFPDWGRMRSAGVPVFACSLTLAEKYPDVFGVPVYDWEWLAAAERRTLGKREGGSR